MEFPKLKRPPEWGVDPVPAEARVLGTFDLFVLWASLGVGLLVFAAGDWLVNGYGLNLGELVAVSVVGSVVGSVLLALAAVPGAKHGVPTMVSLRPIVGRRGSWVASGWNALQLVGWASFELLVMGLGVQRLMFSAGLSVDPLLVIPPVAVLVLGLALAGPLAVVRAWLRKFAIWAVLISTAYIAYAMATSGYVLSSRVASAPYEGGASLVRALDLVIVLPVSWWPLVADYNRFARGGRASFVGTVGGYSVANTVFFVLGGALVLFFYAGNPLADIAYADFFMGMAMLNLGIYPLLVILVDETDNAFANIYSTAVSLQNIRARWRQLPLIVGTTVVATALALYFAASKEGIGGGYNNFLILIGGIFVPLLGVVIADALVVRRGGYEKEEFQEGAPAFRWGALAAWAAATALYLAISWNLLPGWPVTGATLPSFGLAALLHLGFARFARVRSSRG